MNYLVIDTETAGKMGEGLIYDIGWTIIDSHGKKIDTFSACVEEIFTDEVKMETAYYKSKMPVYNQMLAKGETSVLPWKGIIDLFHITLKKYKIKVVVAHNANFDRSALERTCAELKSKKFLQNVQLWDSLAMARDYFGRTKKYNQWCVNNGYLTNHKKPRPQFTVEILYRYIKNDLTFIEDHTAQSDSNIEAEILWCLLKKKKKLKKGKGI